MTALDPQKPLLLIGAGGHAKALLDALASHGHTVHAYVDPEPSAWLEARNIPRMSEDELTTQLISKPQLAMGFVGTTVASLERRLKLMRDYQAKGAIFPTIIHRSAILSAQTLLDDGVQILAGCILNGYSRIATGAILNTAAIIEHDATVGAGAHIAPRSTLLGGASVGECSYIGSGAVIVQNCSVPAHHFVKSLTVHQ